MLVSFIILFFLVSKLIELFNSLRLRNFLKSETSLMKGKEKEIKVLLVFIYLEICLCRLYRSLKNRVFFTKFLKLVNI